MFVTSSTAYAQTLKRAYFAGGCFWGVEYYMEKLNGVVEVKSGYMGGHLKNPTYEDVSYTNSGHLESVEVLYDADRINFEVIARRFFEIHDPTQGNGQGPDIGSQYLSAVFYASEDEKRVIQKLISLLKAKGYDVKTQLKKVSTFYEAEAYHQDYYKRHHKKPYCHGYVKRF